VTPKVKGNKDFAKWHGEIFDLESDPVSFGENLVFVSP